MSVPLSSRPQEVWTTPRCVSIVAEAELRVECAASGRAFTTDQPCFPGGMSRPATYLLRPRARINMIQSGHRFAWVSFYDTNWLTNLCCQAMQFKFQLSAFRGIQLLANEPENVVITRSLCCGVGTSAGTY